MTAPPKSWGNPFDKPDELSSLRSQLAAVQSFANGQGETIAALMDQVAALESERDALHKEIGAFTYLLGDKSQLSLFGGVPTITDLCYTVFMFAKRNVNSEDGGPVDWFTDTKPFVDEFIRKARALTKPTENPHV